MTESAAPGVWLAASRPKTWAAAIAPVVMGTALALGDGGFHAGAALPLQFRTSADLQIDTRQQFTGDTLGQPIIHELLVAAKIHFDVSYSMIDLADAIDRVEAAVREQVPIARPMYIEPDIWRD